jgi:hypothetical protein
MWYSGPLLLLAVAFTSLTSAHSDIGLILLSHGRGPIKKMRKIDHLCRTGDLKFARVSAP